MSRATDSTDTCLLSVKNLSKSFAGKAAVSEVSFDVHAGDCLALVGHNGAGKTTIFKMILGLVRPSGGQISIAGEKPGHSNIIGFLPETVSFQQALTGLELLRFFARLRGVEKNTDFDALLAQVDLTDAGKNRVGTYSKGMRQRLGLAQALIGKPKLLILDEPTSGLDPSSRRSFYRLLDTLRTGGTTILLSSHALTEVEAYTSRVAILRDGALLAKGPIEALAAEAGLPVKIRVQMRGQAQAGSLHLPQGLEAKTGLDKNWLELAVPEAQKLHILHSLAGQPSVVADLRINPPTLDDIYAHYQDGGNGAERAADNITAFPGVVSKEGTSL